MISVGSKVVLTEDTAPEPEVGTVLQVKEGDVFLIRWTRGWTIELEHHRTSLAEVFPTITPQEV